jgi:hypothetical protein
MNTTLTKSQHKSLGHGTMPLKFQLSIKASKRADNIDLLSSTSGGGLGYIMDVRYLTVFQCPDAI